MFFVGKQFISVNNMGQSQDKKHGNLRQDHRISETNGVRFDVSSDQKCDVDKKQENKNWQKRRRK